MSKVRSYAQAREAAAQYVKDFQKRAQTANNLQGTPLADLSAELQDHAKQHGGEHSDFLVKTIRDFARDTHNHRLTAEQAQANIDKAIEAYHSETESAAEIPAEAPGKPTKSPSSK